MPAKNVLKYEYTKSTNISIFLCLQGPSSSEHPSSPSSVGTQQPRDRHSFVQEHFQAQYRWEDIPKALL